jgi:type I restriction enzyme S subunit
MSTAATGGGLNRAPEATEAARRFKSYPAYKDSGVEWLGEIPAGWEVKPLKALSQLQTGLTLGKNYEGRNLVARPYLRVANVQDGYLDLDNIAEVEVPAQDAARYELRTGDVLMTEGGDFDKLGRGHVWENQVAHCLHQNHIFAVRPRREFLSSRYLAIAMSSGYGRAYFTATSKQSTNLASTNSTKLRNLPMPVPRAGEQRAIVCFVDRETARIDLMVVKKGRLIELLQEKRTSVITRAVTKGLDPNAPMKDSGVEWLEEIPAHWELRPIRALARAGYKAFTDGDWIESPFIRDEGIRLIQTGNVGIGEYKEQGFRYIDEETFNAFRCTAILPGDVLICRLADPVGRACLAPDLGCRMIASVDVCILKPASDVHAAFVVYALTGSEYLAWLGGICRGGTRDRVSRSMLGAIRVQKPPLAEQRAIAAFLDQETARIDDLITKVREAIERLKELRTALISAAVTGKIDVREEVA